MTRAEWEEAQRTGRRCGAEHGEGRWHVTCDLPPGHEPPHEAWRGYGTVVYQTWPWKPTNPVRRRTGRSASGGLNGGSNGGTDAKANNGTANNGTANNGTANGGTANTAKANGGTANGG